MTTQPTILTSPQERQELKAMLALVTKSMLEIDNEKQYISETAKEAEKKFGIKARVFRKIASTMYKQNYTDVQAENEHFEYLYESLNTSSKPATGGTNP